MTVLGEKSAKTNQAKYTTFLLENKLFRTRLRSLIIKIVRAKCYVVQGPRTIYRTPLTDIQTSQSIYKTRPDQYGRVFLYLVKSDVQCTLLYSSVHSTSHVFQCNRNTRPCITGHPVCRRQLGSSGRTVLPGLNQASGFSRILILD